MQVTCSNCGARYAVDPLAIGPAGRTVQCARCSHRWFETVEAAPAASPLPRPAERPVPDFVIRPQSHYSAGLPAISPAAPQRPLGPLAAGRWPCWCSWSGAAAFAWRDEIREQAAVRLARAPEPRRHPRPVRAARHGDADRSSRPAATRDRPRHQQDRARRRPLRRARRARQHRPRGRIDEHAQAGLPQGRRRAGRTRLSHGRGPDRARAAG